MFLKPLNLTWTFNNIFQKPKLLKSGWLSIPRTDSAETSKQSLQFYFIWRTSHQDFNPTLLSPIVRQTSPRLFVIHLASGYCLFWFEFSNPTWTRTQKAARKKSLLASQRVRLFEERKQNKKRILHSMIENDCLRQSKNQRGESFIVEFIEAEIIFNVSGWARAGFQRAEANFNVCTTRRVAVSGGFCCWLKAVVTN